MKEWFDSLEEDVKKKVVIGAWVITVVSVLLVLLLPSESIIVTFVSIIFTVALVFSIVFTKWNSKGEKVSTSSTPSMHTVANDVAKEDSPEEIERKQVYGITFEQGRNNFKIDEELLYKYNIDPWGKGLSEEEYNELAEEDTQRSYLEEIKEEIDENVSRINKDYDLLWNAYRWVIFKEKLFC